MDYFTEEDREKAHRALRVTRETGYREGEYRLQFGATEVKVNLGTKDMALIRQLDRLLLRIVCQNYDAVLAMTKTNDPSNLLEMAWAVLAPARFAGGMEGDYEVRFPGNLDVKFSLSQWDESLMKQYLEMVKRLWLEISNG